uniref:Uncharacterized protein n=1 Tax=Arundo donax TaxID=35708 RepID=A0A0A9CF33_ARUDO
MPFQSLSPDGIGNGGMCQIRPVAGFMQCEDPPQRQC